MNRINVYRELSDEARELLQKTSVLKKYKKGDVVCDDANPKNNIYILIIEGYMSKYFLGQNGEKYNMSLLSNSDFLICTKSFLPKKENCFGAKALTDVEVLEIPILDFEQICIHNEELRNFKRNLTVSNYLSLEIQTVNLLSYKAEDRCKLLLEQFPKIFKQLPHYEIAQYLGITKVQMSRIIKNLNI